jgi:hypothetical protein
VVLLQHINYERNALFHGKGGLGAAHIGLNPAGCDNELGTAIIARRVLGRGLAMLQQSGWLVYLSLWLSDRDNLRPDLRP